MRVGLDIGATKILGAVIDADGTVVAQSRQDTRPGADGVLASATAVLDSLASALDGALPSHIGIGIRGIVDRDRGAVSHAVNLGIGGDWFPLAARLADRTGATVRGRERRQRRHLGRARAQRRRRPGLPQPRHRPGGRLRAVGYAAARRPRRGRRDRARAGGPGRPALLVRAARLPGAERVRLRAGRRLAGRRADAPPAEALFAAAAAGNAEAVAVRDRFAAGVADAIRMLGLTVDPAAIIIGGGVAHVGEPLLAAVTAALRAQAAGSPFLAALDLAGRVRLLPGQARRSARSAPP